MTTLNELENQILEFQVAMARECNKYEQLREEFHSAQQSLEAMHRRAEAAERNENASLVKIDELEAALAKCREETIEHTIQRAVLATACDDCNDKDRRIDVLRALKEGK